MEGSRKDREQKSWDTKIKKLSDKKIAMEATVWVCERCNKESHISCGWCDVHDLPVFQCGCVRI